MRLVGQTEHIVTKHIATGLGIVVVVALIPQGLDDHTGFASKMSLPKCRVITALASEYVVVS
jgi:hypothetical protein